jgi:putative oligomerization/nucleic acid binding protein
MPFRRRRPIARMATTAVVAGTAAHMGAKSAQRSAAADQDQYQDQDQAPPAPAPAAEPAAPEAAAPEAADSPQIEQIKQLAALKDQGILTEEEFAASKAKILGI